MTPSGLEHMTFRLVAHVPQPTAPLRAPTPDSSITQKRNLLLVLFQYFDFWARIF